jgi:porphobilinogen deaminase
MNIYIYMVGDDLDEVVSDVSSDISAWLLEHTSVRATLVYLIKGCEITVGIHAEINNKRHLKKPLKFLYSLAKTHEKDFVIGEIKASGEHQDVCFFGFEEGRPDESEIENYLDL